MACAKFPKVFVRAEALDAPGVPLVAGIPKPPQLDPLPGGESDQFCSSPPIPASVPHLFCRSVLSDLARVVVFLHWSSAQKTCCSALAAAMVVQRLFVWSSVSACLESRAIESQLLKLSQYNNAMTKSGILRS